jgi:membrane protein
MNVQKPSDVPEPRFFKSWADRPSSDSSPFISALHYLLRILLITASEFKRNELSLRSSALTYIILLSLVPILAMSTAVLKGLGGGDQLRDVAYTYIASLETSNIFANTNSKKELTGTEIKASERNDNLTGHLRLAVDKLFNYVDKTNFAALGSIGVIGIMLSVILVLGHIESAMNAIWKVSSSRPILRKIADYLTLLFLLPISINVALAASAFLKSPVLSSKMDQLIPLPWLQSLLLKPVPILFITLTLYIMYIFFPNTKVKNLPALTGALLAAILWFMVQNVYISLQIGVAKYNTIYGSFATLPLFLVWMYLGWIFILTGAQIAFSFQNVQTYRRQPFSGSPSLKLGAAFDIMDYIYSAFASRKPVTTSNLVNNLPYYSPLTISDVADDLIKAGVIHISKTDNRLLPITPLEEFDRQQIVNIILGTETLDTAGGILSREVIEAAGAKSSQHH